MKSNLDYIGYEQLVMYTVNLKRIQHIILKKIIKNNEKEPYGNILIIGPFNYPF